MYKDLEVLANKYKKRRNNYNIYAQGKKYLNALIKKNFRIMKRSRKEEKSKRISAL